MVQSSQKSPDGKRRVAVVTDSATALPASMTETAGLFVAKMEVTLEGETFEDGPDGSLDDFYTRLRKIDTVPTTSAPKPAAWLEAYRLASEQAEAILCVTLSANLSAAYDAAKVAAEMAETELPDTEIKVFNTRTAAGSEALIALECARMAANNNQLDAIHDRAKTVAERVRLLAYLDTLEFIHRSGRAPKIAVWATNLFNIKPVMEYSAGNVGAIARPRSRKRAFNRILEETVSDMQDKRAHVNVMHADAQDEARELMRQIDDRVECVELFLTQFHPFMGAHTGPGLVGVSYWGE